MTDDFDPWWREGACAEIGPDLFFVGKGQSIDEAKRTCRGCKVRLKCLVDALDSGVPYGIFGGIAPAHRQTLRRQVQYGTRNSTEVAQAAIHKERYQKPRSQWR